jgi:hypothetical protein
MDLSMITKNPAHLAIAAGAVVLAISIISKGKQVAGVKKKTVQYGGAALIGGGLIYKYVLKKGNGKGPIILPQTAGLPPGAVPVTPQGALPQITSPGPTTGPINFPGTVLSNYSRSRISTAARKANFANQNTLGVFYNDVAT